MQLIKPDLMTPVLKFFYFMTENNLRDFIFTKWGMGGGDTGFPVFQKTFWKAKKVTGYIF